MSMKRATTEETLPPSLDSFVNCTPHKIVLEVKVLTGEDQSEKISKWTFEPNPTSVRLISTLDEIDAQKSSILGAPLYKKQKYTSVVGLPEDSSKPIIVSSVAGAYIADNPDLYDGIVVSPKTDPVFVKRDADGNIASVSGFTLFKWNTTINVDKKDDDQSQDV